MNPDFMISIVLITALVLACIALVSMVTQHLGHVERDPKTGRPAVTSAGRFMGWNTIYGRDGEHGTPYMTRIWVGRLRLHIFHRGDQDPDCHDHPWDFWTFPLTSYVEEVAEPDRDLSVAKPLKFHKRFQLVPAFRLSFRSANHCHRVLAAWDGKHYPDPKDPRSPAIPGVSEGKPIVTFVWRSKPKRSWGFLKNRSGEWCWVAWRDYVFGGGKDGPCQ